MIGGKRKVILLSISLVSVVTTFFLPTYTGALNTSEDFVRCDACHIQEQDEFSRTKVHATIKCTSCHNISEFAPDLYSHNATTYACIYCHPEQNSSKFNNDAHNNFSNASNATNIFTDSNEMCVACHSYIELKIEWRTYEGINIASKINWDGTWELDYSKYGENVTTNYTNYTDYLNRT